MSEKSFNQYRRNFLSKSSTLAAGLAIAPGVILTKVAHAKKAEDAVSSDNRWGMLIDVNKCADGCTDCITECHKENGVQQHGNSQTDPNWIRKVKLTEKQTGAVQTLPMMCQHCENPPCVDVCPTHASNKREDGVVLVDKHRCIGCRYCIMACPYHARSFIHEPTSDQKYPRGPGTVESCTLCVHRLDDPSNDFNNPTNPACVDACNKSGHKAMWFGDIKNPDSEISKLMKEYGGEQIRADLNLNTGVRYQNLGSKTK